MATDAPTRNTMGVARGACGTATGDGTALVVTLGWRPKFVMVWNSTDAMKWEKIDGMSETHAIKTVTAGDQTNDTGSGITIQDNGFTVSATAAASGKALAYFAQ